MYLSTHRRILLSRAQPEDDRNLSSHSCDVFSSTVEAEAPTPQNAIQSCLKEIREILGAKSPTLTVLYIRDMAAKSSIVPALPISLVDELPAIFRSNLIGAVLSRPQEHQDDSENRFDQASNRYWAALHCLVFDGGAEAFSAPNTSLPPMDYRSLLPLGESVTLLMLSGTGPRAKALLARYDGLFNGATALAAVVPAASRLFHAVGGGPAAAAAGGGGLGCVGVVLRGRSDGAGPPDCSAPTTLFSHWTMHVSSNRFLGVDLNYHRN
jgi:hypothetical protein